jgi:hypothetical protein
LVGRGIRNRNLPWSGSLLSCSITARTPAPVV